MYVSKNWAATQKQVNAIHVAEMKMLRWISGVNRLEKIRNEIVRGSFSVRDTADKVQESRLILYSHKK